MNKALKPATALSMKRVVFTLLCCTVLMVFGASAQTIQQIKTDPGNNNPPPSGPILDLGGAYATPPTAAQPIPGNGNETYKQYFVNFVPPVGQTKTVITFAFRDDPAQISFTNASVVDLTADNGTDLLTNGNFATGDLTGWTYADVYGVTGAGFVSTYSGYCYSIGEGYVNCWIDGAVQAYDALTQTIATTPGDTYQISFYVAEDSGIVAPPNASGLPAGYPGSACYFALANAAAGAPPSPCYFSDLSNNNDYTDAGGNAINVAVYAQAGLPPPSQNTLTVTETGLGAGSVTDTYNTSPPPQPPLINCTETGGGAAQTGTCSESDAGGTMVTLTATPSTMAGGLSTFGGWGGACASYGTSSTCTLTMNSAENVTASFVAPSTSPSNTVTLPFNPGTNVTQTFVLCPNGSNPCTDPNATAVTVLIPTVNTFFELTVLFTEFSDNGLCPPAGTVTSNFACRFTSFFNYGTDPNNNTIAPLCYPYLNGNCVQYLLYSGEPGTPPNPAFYSGGVNVELGFNNTSFVPPGPYWTGSTPRGLDTPDSDEFDPLPYGAICSSAMLMGPAPGTEVEPPIYCQFDKDVTTFITPGSGLDPIGNKIPSTNNLVVAFLPTTAGTNPVQTPPTPTAPTLSASCVNGCTIGGDPSIYFTEGTGGTFQVTIPVPAPPAPPVYPAPTLTESGATLPSGLTFNSTLGTISGTPADGTVGTYSINFTASNGVLPNATLSYTLTVSQAALTITASSATMTYGGAVPTITPTITGFVNGDTASSLSSLICTTTATSASPVGTYASSCLAVDSTYAITYTNGTVTVGPAPLTITASSATMTYGGAVPAIIPSFTGLVNADSAGTLGVTCTTTATSTSPPGSYPSSCTASKGGNYTITNVNGTVTVVGLELSTSTVNFGTLYLGQIGIQAIILKNTSTGPITISSINPAGGTAPGDYGDLSFCPPMIVKLPATLPAGKSCAIGVGIWATAKVFSPTASTTTLTIVDSAASQPVLLTAMVINPQAAFSSGGRLTFPTTPKGNSNQQTITVTNPGNTPLILGNSAISVSSSSGYFTLTSTTCDGATVDTASEGGVTSCVINVTFAPKTTGTFTGTLKVTDNAGNSPQTISLSGTT